MLNYANVREGQRESEPLKKWLKIRGNKEKRPVMERFLLVPKTGLEPIYRLKNPLEILNFFTSLAFSLAIFIPSASA